MLCMWCTWCVCAWVYVWMCACEIHTNFRLWPTKRWAIMDLKSNTIQNEMMKINFCCDNFVGVSIFHWNWFGFLVCEIRTIHPNVWIFSRRPICPIQSASRTRAHILTHRIYSWITNESLCYSAQLWIEHNPCMNIEAVVPQHDSTTKDNQINTTWRNGCCAPKQTEWKSAKAKTKTKKQKKTEQLKNDNEWNINDA